MAVEAQRLHLFETTTRECVGNQFMYNAENSLPFFSDGYTVLDPSSTSCITVSNNGGGMSTSKRPREMTGRQMVEDVDNCLIAQHMEKSRTEMMAGRIRFAEQVIALVNDRASKRLRAKEEEIEQLKKLNWALEEKIKNLFTENQVWQYLAQTNEAAANALRANLEHVLQAQQEAAADDDAESCCGDNFEGLDMLGISSATGPWKKGKKHICRSCSVNEPSVLLLPCRHLCLCPACARATDACPICKCCKTGSVNVNLC